MRRTKKQRPRHITEQRNIHLLPNRITPKGAAFPALADQGSHRYGDLCTERGQGGYQSSDGGGGGEHGGPELACGREGEKPSRHCCEVEEVEERGNRAGEARKSQVTSN